MRCSQLSHDLFLVRAVPHGPRPVASLPGGLGPGLPRPNPLPAGERVKGDGQAPIEVTANQ